MLTEPQYKEKLHRLEFLMLADPERDTPEGMELNNLADEVLEYELKHFPESFRRECDFCGCMFPPEQIDPEEGDQWACMGCQDRWAKEDGGVRKY